MSFRRGEFDVCALVKTYAPPNLLSVMPGNKVMLRSGGPEMTVCDVDEHGKAVCQWEGAGGNFARSAFDLRTLTCFGAK